MRKALYFFSILLTLVVFTNCSNDDDSSNNNNETYQKLIGKWYHDTPDPEYNSALTFKNNGQVIYTYWTGNGNTYDNETGSFSVEGDVMTMVFPETVTLTFVQKVVFVNDDKADFQPTGNPNEEAYEGFWFRAED
ncbi:hypothetical protein GWA97_04575 [Flavobacterium sp. LaA7.5]|nr:hypothetical protein [Flavobacterium salilacus subsp. altitudinum]